MNGATVISLTWRELLAYHSGIRVRDWDSLYQYINSYGLILQEEGISYGLPR